MKDTHIFLNTARSKQEGDESSVLQNIDLVSL